MVTVIIPSRNEQGYLEKTIKAVLQAARGELEIIVVLDGWLPDPQISFPVSKTKQLKWIYNHESQGQRQAINQAAREAKGDFVMKLDAHCAVGDGFDVILAEDCLYTDTMLPRMYNLDVETWQPKYFNDEAKAIRNGKLHDFMYIGWKDGHLRTLYYTGKLNNEIHAEQGDIVETMSCMGPCFFMHKDRFWELGGCDEGHGGWGQQGIEVSCKAWLSGGRLVTNRKTWFAHWFRGGGVPQGHKAGFPYRMTEKQVEKARCYSEDLWLNNKWEHQTRNFEWLVDKFNPPTWDKKAMIPADIKKQYYRHMISGGRMPTWLGVKVVKYPGDILLYQQAIFENKPDVIVETGTYMGGSALFFASIFDLLGNGEVITVDVKHDRPLPQHPRIKYVTGPSTSAEVLTKVKELTNGKKVMVVLDSNHHRRHVKRELLKYTPIASPGQFVVVEDTNYSEIGKKDGPDEAVEWFLKKSKRVKREPVEEQFMFSLNPGGWLRRV